MTRTQRSYLALVVGLAAVYALQFVFDGMGSYDQRIVANIGINMIMAVSLNLINGFTGQFSLGHAGFMSIGAYSTAAFVTIVAPKIVGETPTGLTLDLVLLAGLLFGGLIAAVAGLIVGVPSLRLKGDYLAIVTLGFGEIIRVLIQLTDNEKFLGGALGGALGMSNLPRIATFTWIFVIVVIAVFIIQNLMHSTYGKGFLAVRDDEVAAEAMGVNTTRYKVVAFVIGSFFAGIGGGLYAHYNQFISPQDFGFLRSVEFVVMVILGGMGSTYGVLFAAALLTFIPEWLRDVELIGIKFRDFRMSLYALMLIVLMLTRPQGLFGNFHFLETIKRRMRARRQTSAPNLRA